MYITENSSFRYIARASNDKSLLKQSSCTLMQDQGSSAREEVRQWIRSLYFGRDGGCLKSSQPVSESEAVRRKNFHTQFICKGDVAACQIFDTLCDSHETASVGIAIRLPVIVES